MKYLTKEQRNRLATAPKITQSLYAALDHADEAERLLVECAKELTQVIEDCFCRHYTSRCEKCTRLRDVLAKLKASGI